MAKYIIRPIATEKTMLMMERENKLSFYVTRNASKDDIKEEVEELFSVKVDEVNTLITRNGKKAIIKLSPEFSADEVGGRIGIF
ncbi:MAG TPA: 50S ribosomal protein L23 [Thermoplasmataceae archaeon]|nr:50S ribosomal protein L23 [Thermoplasmatales archaeon AK]HLH85994.1 50S ribosomal protein L23 [Thermoplasmataceae archaeon]